MSGRAASGLRLAAPAKVNLSLRVTGRRDDGYHLIDTAIAFAETGDVVTATASDEIELEIDGPFAAALDAGAANLVVRAARALAAEVAGHEGAALRLTKNLPVASGIGGGSADAAATLRLLSRLWRLDIEPARMAGIAQSLGADVPACLVGRSLHAGGIGEVIDALPRLPPVTAVLVNNRLPVETASVFARRAGSFSTPSPMPAAFDDAAALARWCCAMGNDLTEPAIRAEPSIADVLAALKGEEGCLLAQLSGSGATCFALFASPDAAVAAALHLTDVGPDWWIRTTRFRDVPAEIEEIGG